jgi:hypothetical protein
MASCLARRSLTSASCGHITSRRNAACFLLPVPVLLSLRRVFACCPAPRAGSARAAHVALILDQGDLYYSEREAVSTAGKRGVHVSTVDNGGASPVSMLLAARALVESGQCSAVAIVAGDSISSLEPRDFLSRADAQLSHPLPPPGRQLATLPHPAIPHGYSLCAEAHMREHGVTREQLAMVAVVRKLESRGGGGGGGAGAGAAAAAAAGEGALDATKNTQACGGGGEGGEALFAIKSNTECGSVQLGLVRSS